MKDRGFLVDVGMRDLPFPMRVTSRVDPAGQSTIANISISAHIMHDFEARWIDKFVQVLHQHRDRIGTRTLRVNVMDYLAELKATAVRVDFEFPFFIEKVTPVSREKCLVRYLCTYSAKASRAEATPKIVFGIQVPVVTTYPGSAPDKPGGLFGQLSVVVVETESQKDTYPEDLVDIVDRHALSPVYSFLSEEDQLHIIQKIHSEAKTSVAMTADIQRELSHNQDIDWFSVRTSNHGMIHSYSTIIGTEKSRWVPFSGYEDEI
jgi:GTP cyclohydrolase IB